MPTFNGTDGNDVITPQLVSPGVTSDGAPAPGADPDLLIGAAGADTLDGGGGADTLLAGPGDDRMLWSSAAGNDSIDGGLGLDTLDADFPFGVGTLTAETGGVRLNDFVGHADVTGVERINLTAAGSNAAAFLIRDLAGTGVQEVNIDLSSTGSDPDDIFVTATNGADVVTVSTASPGTTPGGGVTTVTGLGPSVNIAGATADDLLTLSFGDGDDVLNASGDTMATLVDGGTGADTLIGGAGSDVLQGNDGNDVLIGGANVDVLSAGAGDNDLTGGAGDDFFDLSDPSGRSVIEDFQPHGKGPHDQLLLPGPDDTFTELVAHGEIFQRGDDVVITNGTKEIAVLKHVLITSLNDTDFLTF